MESLMSGERLKRKAFLNKEGVKYAARNSKEKICADGFKKWWI